MPTKYVTINYTTIRQRIAVFTPDADLREKPLPLFLSKDMKSEEAIRTGSDEGRRTSNNVGRRTGR